MENTLLRLHQIVDEDERLAAWCSLTPEMREATKAKMIEKNPLWYTMTTVLSPEERVDNWKWVDKALRVFSFLYWKSGQDLSLSWMRSRQEEMDAAVVAVMAAMPPLMRHCLIHFLLHLPALWNLQYTSTADRENIHRQFIQKVYLPQHPEDAMFFLTEAPPAVDRETAQRWLASDLAVGYAMLPLETKLANPDFVSRFFSEHSSSSCIQHGWLRLIPPHLLEPHLHLIREWLQTNILVYFQLPLATREANDDLANMMMQWLVTFDFEHKVQQSMMVVSNFPYRLLERHEDWVAPLIRIFPIAYMALSENVRRAHPEVIMEAVCGAEEAYQHVPMEFREGHWELGLIAVRHSRDNYKALPLAMRDIALAHNEEERARILELADTATRLQIAPIHEFTPLSRTDDRDQQLDEDGLIDNTNEFYWNDRIVYMPESTRIALLESWYHSSNHERLRMYQQLDRVLPRERDAHAHMLLEGERAYQHSPHVFQQLGKDIREHIKKQWDCLSQNETFHLRVLWKNVELKLLWFNLNRILYYARVEDWDSYGNIMQGVVLNLQTITREFGDTHRQLCVSPSQPSTTKVALTSSLRKFMAQRLLEVFLVLLVIKRHYLRLYNSPLQTDSDDDIKQLHEDFKTSRLESLIQRNHPKTKFLIEQINRYLRKPTNTTTEEETTFFQDHASNFTQTFFY